MAAQILSDHELFDRIISTLAEMRDLLRNESRRWASLPPLFFEPPPNSAPTPPPAVSATAPPTPSPVTATSAHVPVSSPIPASVTPPAPIPSPPPAAISTMTPTTLGLEQPAATKTAPATRPFASFQLLTPVSSHPVQPTLKSSPSLDPFAPRSSLTPSPKLIFTYPCHNFYGVRSQIPGLEGPLRETLVKDATLECEWRPPWWCVMSRSYVARRTEWRPPWLVHANNPA